MAAAIALQPRRIPRVHNCDLQGGEVLRIPRQDREAGIAGGCRDQNIGEPEGSAGPARLVRQPAREARRIGCHRRNAAAIKMQHAFEPCRQTFGFPRGALPAGLGDAAFDLGDGDNAQIQVRRLGLKPRADLIVSVRGGGRKGGNDVGVDEIHGSYSPASRIGVASRSGRSLSSSGADMSNCAKDEVRPASAIPRKR